MRSWNNRGFTIVELLIVIVVIGILAAITTAAYNGVQNRANTTKTVSAVSQWVKLLNLYRADNGSFPTSVSCLGSGYGRGFDGAAATGGQCRQDNSSDTSGITISPTFMNAMSNYVQGGGPTPAFATFGSATFPWYRGAYFYPAYTGSAARIDFVLKGSSSPCPDVGQVSMVRYQDTASNTIRCIARLEEV